MKLLLSLILLTGCLFIVQCGEDLEIVPATASIEFLGHSSFLIVTPDSTRIITDPFGNTVPSYYDSPDSLTADIVLVSHSHADHNQTSTILGNPVLFQSADTLTVGSVHIQGFLSEHGDWGTTAMGDNIIFVLDIEGIKIVHLGENRNVNETEILSAIAQADVLIAPVGQVASISFEQLDTLVENTNCRTVIPSHYSLSSDNRYYESSTVEEYIEALPEGVEVIYTDILEVSSGMPEQVVVLTPLCAKEGL